MSILTGIGSDNSPNEKRGVSLDLPPLSRARSIRSLRRATSISNKRIHTLHSLVTGPVRRNSLSPGTRSANATRSVVITRVDIPSPINTSISALDTLLEQQHRRQSQSKEPDKRFSVISSADSSASSSPTVRQQSDDDFEDDSSGELTPATLGRDMHDEVLRGGSEPTKWPPSPTTIRTNIPETIAEDSSQRLPNAPFVNEILDSLFPQPDAHTKLRHEYFNVATVDGQPSIPDKYVCPSSICRDEFLYFDALQAHWSEHPWNRRGVLLPVTAGGIRRLSFWQHKAKYFKSLMQGVHVAALPEEDGLEISSATEASYSHSAYRNGLWSLVSSGTRQSLSIEASISPGAVSTSDLGDISLFGPRSYFVSPRVLPMDQVRLWEAQRDKGHL